jgi:hypothetical protein
MSGFTWTMSLDHGRTDLISDITYIIVLNSLTSTLCLNLHRPMPLDHGRDRSHVWHYIHHSLKPFDRHFMSEFTCIMPLYHGRTIMDVMSDMRSFLPLCKSMMHVVAYIKWLSKNLRLWWLIMSDMRSFLPWSMFMMHVNSDYKWLSKGTRPIYRDFYSTSSLKQQSAGRHVAPLGHIILIPSRSIFALSH